MDELALILFVFVVPFTFLLMSGGLNDIVEHKAKVIRSRKWQKK